VVGVFHTMQRKGANEIISGRDFVTHPLGVCAFGQTVQQCGNAHPKQRSEDTSLPHAISSSDAPLVVAVKNVVR